MKGGWLSCLTGSDLVANMSDTEVARSRVVVEEPCNEVAVP
jgi:hypothetical protein